MPQFDRVLDAVTDLGLDPTGSSDTSDALDTALNTEGTLVEFPSGTYHVANRITSTADRVGVRGLGDVVITVPAGFKDYWLYANRITGLVVENIKVQWGWDRAAGLSVIVHDDALVKNYEILGAKPQHSSGGIRGMYYDVLDPDGHGELINYVATGPGEYVRQGQNYAVGLQGLLTDESHQGTLVARRCDMRNWTENGFYCSRPGGVVEIYDSYFENCDNAAVRLASEGSRMENCVIVFDIENGNPDNKIPHGANNPRGLWLEQVPSGGGPDVEIVDCDVYYADGGFRALAGSVHVDATMGGCTFRNCRFYTEIDDASNQFNVFVNRPDVDGKAQHPLDVTFVDCHWTGPGAAPAIKSVKDNGEYRVHAVNPCVDMPNGGELQVVGTSEPIPSTSSNALLVTGGQLEAIAGHIDAGDQPWTSAWNRVQSSADAALDDSLTSTQSHQFDRNADYQTALHTKNRVRDLAIAHVFSDIDSYAERAIDQLYHWFLNPNTYQEPNQNGQFATITQYITIPSMFYAAELLRDHSYWSNFSGNRPWDSGTSSGPVAALERWATDWQSTFRDPQCNNIWVWRAFARGIAGTFANNDSVWQQALDEYKSNCAWGDYGMEVTGGFQNELWRTNGYRYQLYRMKAHVMFCEVARVKGLDLYPYNDLKLAFDFMAPYVHDPSEWQWGAQSLDFDQNHEAGVYELAYSYWEDPAYLDVITSVVGRPVDEGRLLGDSVTLTHGDRHRLVLTDGGCELPRHRPLFDDVRSGFSAGAFGEGEFGRSWPRTPGFGSGRFGRGLFGHGDVAPFPPDSYGEGGYGEGPFATDGGCDVARNFPPDETPEPETMKTLAITSNGDGTVRWSITVDGSLEPGPNFEDDIRGSTASGRVGPLRGTDDVRYTGKVTRWSLTGDGTARITIDGLEVDPETLMPFSEPELPVDLSDFTSGQLIDELRDRGMQVTTADYSDDELISELEARGYERVTALRL